MLIAVEIISVFLNLLYIYFAIRQRPVAWIFGTLAALLSIYLFYKNNYVGSAVLNGVYAIQGLFGFFQWQFYLKNEIPGFKLSFKKHIALIIAILLVFLTLNFYKKYFHLNLLVQFDVVLAIGSIVATFLEIKKDISCWYYWIALNIGFTILYTIQHLYLYAALMLVLGIFSIFALKEWQKKRPVSV